MKGDTNTICECYHNLPNNEGECWGTRERERCYCNGDGRYCSYYLEKRNSAIDAERKDKNMSKEKTTLNTAEMWLKAQEDGKTYICNSVLYNKKTGFISVTELKPWPISAFDNIENLMEAQWSLYQEEIMTKAEAEKKFGIRIVG